MCIEHTMDISKSKRFKEEKTYRRSSDRELFLRFRVVVLPFNTFIFDSSIFPLFHYFLLLTTNLRSN